MRIKITTDSTCDLPAELIAEHDIGILPLSVIKDGVGYRDGEEITTSGIYAHVSAGGELCSTAAVNVEEYRACFQKASQEYDGVLHINIGSQVSSCYQNAVNAAEEFANVRVIDSQSFSGGQGLVVLEACRLAKECEDIDALHAAVQAVVGKVEVTVLLDKLDYVVKGGRCSALLALGANLFKLKVCLGVVDGTLKVIKKYRGKLSKCLEEYIKERLDGRTDIVRDVLHFAFTEVESEALTAARGAVAQYGGFREVRDIAAGCTIACHCGPGTLGLMMLRK